MRGPKAVTKHTLKSCRSAVGLVTKHTMKSWSCGETHAEELSESWALKAGWIILLLSCSSTGAFPDTVFVVLLRTAVSEVHKLLRTGGVGVISAEQVLSAEYVTGFCAESFLQKHFNCMRGATDMPG